jgi:hypothetical protein
VAYRPNRPFTHDTSLLSESGYAAWMIDELLRATTPLPPLGAAFTRAERDTGINARYLVAHAILETGWGTSWIAQWKHNLFGHHAYDRDPLRYATRFPSFAAGIAAVSQEIRTAYLSPDGPWWRGFPTLRGVNRFYASDPVWADKIAVLANEIDAIVLTLHERGLHFGWPRIAKAGPGTSVAARSSIVVEVPWTSRTLGLPAAIRFAVRWTPVALAEGDPVAPTVPPASTWTPVGTSRRGHSVRLSVAAPSLAGSWRLEIQARDSDGWPLPATDTPQIRSLALRVAAATEATISVGVATTPPHAEAGGVGWAMLAAVESARSRLPSLVATVRNVGRTTIPAVAPDGTPTLLEAWSLPLAADGEAVRLTGTALPADLPPGGQVTLHLPRPGEAAVVVVRLAGDPTAIGREVPTVVLSDSSASGEPTLAQLHVPDLRDCTFDPLASNLTSASVAHAPVPPARGSAGASAGASVMQADAAGDVAIGLVPEPAFTRPNLRWEPAPPPPAILVRTLTTLPGGAGDPTSALLAWPAGPTINSPATIGLHDVPAGIRLVVVALVPDGGSVADPATLGLAWVRIADPDVGPTPR